MAFTPEQQAKIDTAQARLTNAKSAYQQKTNAYNDAVSAVQKYYSKPIEPSTSAATWYNPVTNSCNFGIHSIDCHNKINSLNDTIIPELRAALIEQNAAQSNYDIVLSSVIAEATGDPTNKQNTIVQAASAKQKWIFAAIVVIVIGALIFSYFKWFKK